jgi:hypothetical protein
MRRTKTLYWIFTGLFAAFMTYSAVPSILNSEESVKMMSNYLGYPLYFTPFLGVAKLLGSIAIIIPGYWRIKEWAYAGFFFDLIGATYSMIAVGGLQPQILFMILPFALAILSYLYYHQYYGALKSTSKQTASDNKFKSSHPDSDIRLAEG